MPRSAVLLQKLCVRDEFWEVPEKEVPAPFSPFFLLPQTLSAQSSLLGECVQKAVVCREERAEEPSRQRASPFSFPSH